MKVKTSELTGAALDFAVAKCEGVRLTQRIDSFKIHGAVILQKGGIYSPSTNWGQVGPIIERERISVFITNAMGWRASLPYSFDRDVELYEYGPNPLIAAMRCYVASKLGDEVEIPEYCFNK